jgi:hypothetical protein
MTLSVIGAGFGRTGTMSLKLALEQLGFGPCFHMAEFFTAANGEALKVRWEEVAFGAAPPDWDDVFAGYRSTVDWPSAAYWRELADRYPSAKIILTVRDADRWYGSAAATIFSGRSSDEELAKRTDTWARMVRRIIAENTFDGRTSDREHAIAVFRRHNDEVRSTIAPERLLVYEAGAGWEPLCRFLGVEVPETPFPQENTTEKFKARRAEEAAARGEAVGPASAG